MAKVAKPAGYRSRGIGKSLEIAAGVWHGGANGETRGWWQSEGMVWLKALRAFRPRTAAGPDVSASPRN